MTKLIAWLRTVFLVFIVGFTVYSGGLAVIAGGVMAVSVDSLYRLGRAAWLAIAWIAVETAATWLLVWIRRSKAKPASPAPPPTSAAPQA